MTAIRYTSAQYFANFLSDKNIKDVFYYPGGMVTHLQDALSKVNVKQHICYHEQASGFSASSYALVSNNVGFCFATSGPGASNLITAIANAYYDNIPVVFITGQVNTYEQVNNLKVKQNGFQEMPIVDIVQKITKYAVSVKSADEFVTALNYAYNFALTDKKGPVLIDLPMDIQREIVSENIVESEQIKNGYSADISRRNSIGDVDSAVKTCLENLKCAKRPVFLVGNGVHLSKVKKTLNDIVQKLKIPVVTSLLGVDLLPEYRNNLGIIGSYGNRVSNYVLQNSDLIISVGSRLPRRQTGDNLSKFAVDAKLIRIDIDKNEFTRVIKDGEIDILCNLSEFMPYFNRAIGKFSYDFKKWTSYVSDVSQLLCECDNNIWSQVIKYLSNFLPSEAVITADVGQNQIWVAQGFSFKGQRCLFSGGFGAMGFSLPAAYGAWIASKKAIYCFVGDGGLQMNIQEMQTIIRDNANVCIVLLNNNSLGMIRHFQEMYFESNFTGTTPQKGYSNPDFIKVANAFGLDCLSFNAKNFLDSENSNVLSAFINKKIPRILEITFDEPTYIYPKLGINSGLSNQEPSLSDEVFEKLKMIEKKYA